MAERSPRKLAVILHADVVGSTALVRINETLAHERIQDAFHRFSKTIESYGGVARELRGDALVAEFERASDAVSAAVAFQAENSEFNTALDDNIRPELRMGISMGEVVIADNTITGESVVLAQRLEQLAESGGVCIQGAAYETVPQRIPFEYESLGEQRVKGFEEPVRAYAVTLKPGEKIPAPESTVASVEMHPELPDKPSIAVLPFTNMSGDREQEYFADGITEDIITELSRFPSLFVIARHSSFAFKAETIDIKEVGDRLGVRYLVEGSVRKAGNRVRITAQLIDAATGNHIWAERYDRSIEDIFEVQDEVTYAIVATLPGQIEKAVAERTGRKRTESMTAYDCLLRGNRHFHRVTYDDLLEAKRLYQQAIELDPQFALAYSRSAATDNLLTGMGFGTEDTYSETLATVQRALALDRDDNWSQLTLGWTLLRKLRFDESEEQFERALALNRNDANCMSWVAMGFVFLGRTEEAFDLISKAMRLNPLHPDSYHLVLGNAAYFTGRYEDALREFRLGGEYGVWHHANLAAAYGQTDRTEEAQAEMALFVEARRKQFVKRGTPLPASDLELVTERIERLRRRVDQDRYLEGLRKAGLSD